MAALSAAHDISQRLDLISAMLSDHLLDVGVEPVRQLLGAWNDHWDGYAPFGYSHPRWHDPGDGRAVCSVRFCPERIVQTTSWLNDFDLEEYLVAVEVQLDYDITHHEMNERDAAKWFLKFILANAPGSWRLMVEVQDKWLMQP
jgi:hypothetical protein